MSDAMSTDDDRDSRLDTPTRELSTEMMFHPLAEFESESLYEDNMKSLRGLLNDNHPVVCLQESLYIGTSRDQLLIYSLTERTFDYLPTPKRLVKKCDYALAEWDNQLVLVGVQSKNFVKSRKVWVCEGHMWNGDVVPDVPGDGAILSATSHNSSLIVMLQQSVPEILEKFNRLYYRTRLCCFDASQKNWSIALFCPQIDASDIIVHDNNLYAIAHDGEVTLHKTSFSKSIGDSEWNKLNVAKGKVVSNNCRLAIFENKLFIVSLDSSKVKLYTPLTDSVLYVGDLSQVYSSVYGVFGLDQSLFIIGVQTNRMSPLSVVKFTSKVSPYDSNGRFTLEAIERLEKVGGICVVTNPDLESQISEIKQFAGFTLQLSSNKCATMVHRFMVYMSSWLQTYESQVSDSVTKPTWGNFLSALELVNHSELARQIEGYLKKAPKSNVKEPEEKEAPAIEDLRKLHVKLKQLKDQLSSNQLIDPQKIKEDVCTTYHQCCAISHKVQLEQTGFKNEIEQLRTENRKLTEEKMSAETGDPPLAKRQRKDDNSIKESIKPTIKELMRKLRGKVAYWEDIGIELDFKNDELKEIKANISGDTKSCLRELLNRWLKRDLNVSWNAIAEAVEEGLDDQELSKEISEKYC